MVNGIPWFMEGLRVTRVATATILYNKYVFIANRGKLALCLRTC